MAKKNNPSTRSVTGACPACAAPVEFKISSALVTVCGFCNSVVARTDRELKDLGKVAAIVESNSPLAIGMSGRYHNKPFQIVGRIQYQHSAGGVWDEWYAAFSSGRWGWLAEAQGKFFITHQKKLPSDLTLPHLDDVEVGARFKIGSSPELTVAEVGSTQPIAAEGEIPFQLQPGVKKSYLDAHGPDKEFATIDYSTSPPILYAGKEVTLDELGVAGKRSERDLTKTSAAQLKCPTCASTLNLVAPDKSQRVCCPSCGSLSDIEQGNLKYLKTLEVGKLSPIIPLGEVGTFFDTEYTVTGFMQRFVTYDGSRYYWYEYLLYNPDKGFRWLVHSDGNWSFCEPISPGDLNEDYQWATHDGKTFKIFQSAKAEVSYVIGEFYWKVSVGEETLMRDYICPPQSLTVERVQVSEEQKEMNCTLAHFITVEEVEETFGIESIARGWKVAPNQPKPIDGRVYLMWLGFGLGLLFIDFMCATVFKRPVDHTMLVWALCILSVIPVGALMYGHSFERRRWADSEFSPYNTGEE